jgi:phage baseplate assembly protein V
MHHTSEERNAIRTMLRRASIASSDDSGTQQLLALSGLSSDALKKIVHIQPFGFSSNPPVGGEGLILCPGGRSDRAMFFGGEHPAHRPQNTPSGGTIVYDAFGDIISIVQQNIRIVHATQVSIEAPAVIIKGALTVTQTFNVQNSGGVSAPATVTGSIAVTGDVTAGNISVINHVHGGVQPGGSNTGAATG